MEKSPDAFRTISEAAEELDLPQHVLRFWETRFSTIKPLKRGGGRRYYRPEDVLLLKGIRHLLYDQGFTIKGVQRILKDQGSRYVIALSEGVPLEDLVQLQADLAEPEIEDPVEIRHHQTIPAVMPEPRSRLLEAKDRERLEGVLRELLDCKRLLERAREN
ncbi:MAG TPA: MerR family transcriptional regulator [Devosiaceae bacterium]